MDSGDDGRCLPSMWTRRGDRLDFMDMCASPPSDGFFYANNQSRMNKAQAAKTQGNCNKVSEEISRDRETLLTSTIQNASDSEGTCLNSGSSTFFKSFVPSYQPTSGSSTSGELSPNEGFMVSGKILNMSSFELEKWAKDNVRGSHHPSSRLASPHDEISYDDSALTPADHRSIHPITPTITKTDVGGSMNLVEKLSTPDVTPCSTPLATPVCSPQVARKSGNPFFTGDPSRRDEGSWLFRSAPKETMDNTLYEAKVEIQSQPNSQALKKKVKYVPRPSHLRELNFWSPTSM